MISKALVIDRPWINLILNGEKVWEMRSQRATHRGPFGLIEKGTGLVVGVATLARVSGPYSNEELGSHYNRHLVGPDIYELPEYKWRYAWELEKVVLLAKPVRYKHKAGAVTWVQLNPEATDEIGGQLDAGYLSCPNLPGESVKAPVANIAEKRSAPTSVSARHVTVVTSNSSNNSRPDYIPQARDGTRFTQEFCCRNGVYTVGEKGDEKKFRNYHAALEYLKSMATAKWRRPNANGNWGIVSAVEWCRVKAETA